METSFVKKIEFAVHQLQGLTIEKVNATPCSLEIAPLELNCVNKKVGENSNFVSVDDK